MLDKRTKFVTQVVLLTKQSKIQTNKMLQKRLKMSIKEYQALITTQKLQKLQIL